MTREEIINDIQVKEKAIVTWLEIHDIAKWENGPEGKWTTGQHILHLIQSAAPLSKAMSLPKFLLAYRFGKANRPLRNYNEVIQKYQTKLAQMPDVVSPFSMNMSIPKASDKEALIKNFRSENQRLIGKFGKWSEAQLDKYVLPHPFLGRMPVRELVMWSSYHIEHHRKILVERY